MKLNKQDKICNKVIEILTNYKKDKNRQNAVIEFDHWISENSSENFYNTDGEYLWEDFNSFMGTLDSIK